MGNKDLSENEIRTLAIYAFNKTWEYIENKKRTMTDNEMMIHCSHTSRYFWGLVGTPINLLRGDWQLSRVYTLLNRGQEALNYAKLCLQLVEENKVEGFDLAFAYESMSRSFAAIGDKEGFEKYYKLALSSGDLIDDKEDRDYFFRDLKGGNWFGFN